ncbi:MAG: PQQ-binding-like beta-propeller repeat protein [Armatimonadota bacterium]|nr:PQQ-binding-like beta-propeller repeat protein [Armatimonadota bacterium]
MGRVWGVSCMVLALLKTAFGDIPNVPATPRTPHGLLWAGTTFQLRAVASTGEILTGYSNDAQVRVGKLIRWQWQVESAAGAAVPQGQEAIFRVRLTNQGNGWDHLVFGLQRFELENNSAWTVELLEDRSGNGQVPGSPAINGAGSPIHPTHSMLYFVRMRPPAHNVPTDGAWAVLSARTSDNATQQVLGEFVAGVVRQAWVPLRAWSGGVEREQRVAPILYQGRLFWMYTDTTSRATRILYTRDTVEATQGTTLGNELRVYQHALQNFTPTGFSVVLGDGWFVGAGNQLVRIHLPTVVSNGANPLTVVGFPQGVQPRLDILPASVNGRLFVAGTDGRIHAINASGARVAQSMPIPASYGEISANLVVIDRLLYVGTNQGWVVQIDLLTGNLRTARRVATQRIQHLAPAAFGRALLARAGNRDLLGIHPQQLTQLWRRTLPEDIISNIASSSEREVAALLTQSGMLYALNTRTGGVLPHYPQRIFGENDRLRDATIGVMRRNNRRATYLYVLGQLENSSNSPQGLLRLVTLENPYNRREYGADTLRIGSDYLPVMLFTGNNQSSYCLIAARRDASSGGTVAAIPLQ